MPDNPATPGPDPMCMDAAAMAWAHAWISHEMPPKGKIGFMYMLKGGTDASNTDPYATQPTTSNNWLQTGPHVISEGCRSGYLGPLHHVVWHPLSAPDGASGVRGSVQSSRRGSPLPIIKRCPLAPFVLGSQ